ncbi:hypothetical protein [Kitasatospora paranensis]|uniref:Integral membrane protein n=1 Tax=Kitasatospora paranensis TaxID=258053 RepID=A0ABW2FUE5_9ACTN
MSGPLHLVADEVDWDETVQLRTLPRPRPRPAAEARTPTPLSADPIDELAERLADLCAYAVHPYEIAAFLESDGMTDQQAALVYGRPDAFTLAEELFARVPRRYRGTGAEFSNPWRADPWRCLVRGLVFALPGLGYLLGAHLFAPGKLQFGLPAGAAALAVATLAGWGWNQGLAHRAYGWLGRGQRRSAGHCLTWGASAGAALATGCAWAVGGPPAALWFAAGQSVYLASATVLLVLGRETVLLAALAPSTVGAGVVLAVPVPGIVRTAVLLLTVVLALGLAGRELVGCLRAPRETTDVYLPYRDEVPQVVFGLAAGTMTLIAGLGDTLHHALGHTAPAVGNSPAGPQMVALSLSLGLAEWLLFRYRELAVGALRTSHGPAEFTRRTTGYLLGCLLCYLSVVALLDAAATLLWPSAAGLDTASLTALVLLGAALWLALLLNAFGLSWTTALACAACAGYQVTALLAGAAPTTDRLAGCGAAALLLTLIAVPVLGRTTKHR